ncbi:sensor histidine kinase [Parapedobacter koreensis]|uniref:Histidine kinase n=1 Tax=Parapedobacter koreensis TaxID=332977 RepID=A0A1H7QTA2_9SPHI|nr:histidine kinase [Parapedobacter koreensis]SEL51240.1 Histidine kinase [Parapedobacter koreensis]
MKLNRIEIILATAIYLFILILINSNNAAHQTIRQAIALSAYISIIYGAFVTFTQWISPAFFQKRYMEAGISFTFALFFATWFGLSFCFWVREYHTIRMHTFWDYLPRGETLGITLLVISLILSYEGIKRLIRYGQNKQQTLATRIAQESVVVLGGSIFIFFLLLTIHRDLAGLWFSGILYTYVLYALNTYWLIPTCEKRRYRFGLYLLLALPLSFALFIPFGVFFVAFTSSDEPLFFLEWFCIMLVVLPLSYYLYHRQKARIAQLFSLKRELGQTSADLSFLRSQINPHFLFNILNTLYGMALQEKAERTASGIQKLGDLMRFMLHENNQDKILLAREVEYLRNYIDLQLLRTATSPGIIVEHTINDALESTYIAPMLLIPFVENAFKHGISLQEKSWIKISLYEAEGNLFFDVHNSIHRKSDSDPERGHSGIGLENVKQRLAMLYPGRHELVIRETTQEFFVHLTLQLS